MCVCGTCMHVSRYIFTCVSTCAWRSEISTKYLPPSLSDLFPGSRFQRAWNFPTPVSRAGLLAPATPYLVFLVPRLQVAAKPRCLPHGSKDPKCYPHTHVVSPSPTSHLSRLWFFFLSSNYTQCISWPLMTIIIFRILSFVSLVFKRKSGHIIFI